MSRLNQILLVLLAVQAVGLVIGRAATHQPVAQRTVTMFPGFEAEKVTSIEVIGAPKVKDDDPPQNRVTLAKNGLEWGIANADNFPVDKTKVDELLEKIGKLKSRNQVLDSSTYHEKLEVSADKFQRKLTVTAGDKKTVLYVGTSPRFKNVHVRLDGEDAVYLVNDFGTTQLGDRAWSWVNREYVKIEGDNLWQVKVKNAKGEFQLDKDPVSKEWAVLGLDKPMDKTAVNDIVRKASQVNLETPVGKKVEASYGFDQPQAMITLVTGTSTITGAPPKTTETVTMQVGKKIDAANQYYVKASSNEYVVQVAGWGVEPLINKAVADLAQKEQDTDKKK